MGRGADTGAEAMGLEALEDEVLLHAAVARALLDVGRPVAETPIEARDPQIRGLAHVRVGRKKLVVRHGRHPSNSSGLSRASTSAGWGRPRAGCPSVVRQPVCHQIDVRVVGQPDEHDIIGEQTHDVRAEPVAVVQRDGDAEAIDQGVELRVAVALQVGAGEVVEPCGLRANVAPPAGTSARCTGGS